MEAKYFGKFNFNETLIPVIILQLVVRENKGEQKTISAKLINCKKMKNILFAVLIFSVLTGCVESSETKFEKDGVTFTCPAGWKIVDEEAMDNKGYFISIEKDGFSSSGLFTMTYFYDSLDLPNFIEVYKDGFTEQFIYKNSNLSFEAPVRDEFNKYSSISSKYTVSILNVEHQGLIHVLHGNNKTIALIIQEAVEDKDNNRLGFDSIEQSFTLD